jgi:hypothetical protein
MFKVTLAGATFLVVIAVLPQVLSSNLPNMPRAGDVRAAPAS